MQSLAALLGTVPKVTTGSPGQAVKEAFGTAEASENGPHFFVLDDNNGLMRMSSADVVALKPMAHHLSVLHLVGLPTSSLTPDILWAMGAALGAHLAHLRMGVCDGLCEVVGGGVGTWGQLLRCLPALHTLDLLLSSGSASCVELQSLGQACKGAGRAFTVRLFCSRSGAKEEAQQWLAQNLGSSSLRCLLN